LYYLGDEGDDDEDDGWTGKVRKIVNTMINKKVQYTVKKVPIFPSPCRDVTNQIFFRPGIIQLFPARESSGNDIPAGDGKTITFFYSVKGVDNFNVYPTYSLGELPLTDQKTCVVKKKAF
jgi:hypothetical protein